MTWLPGAANPGSEAAVTAGCLCPVADNCRGRFAPRPPDGGWVVVGCPVHDAVPTAG